MKQVIRVCDPRSRAKCHTCINPKIYPRLKDFLVIEEDYEWRWLDKHEATKQKWVEAPELHEHLRTIARKTGSEAGFVLVSGLKRWQQEKLAAFNGFALGQWVSFGTFKWENDTFHKLLDIVQARFVELTIGGIYGRSVSMPSDVDDMEFDWVLEDWDNLSCALLYPDGPWQFTLMTRVFESMDETLGRFKPV